MGLVLSENLQPEDALHLAVADFLRDAQRECHRLDAAQRVNALAAQLGISAAAALERYARGAA